MWVHLAVCELVAWNVSSLAASVGSQPLIFAQIVGSKVTLFASPSLTVCRPLHLGLRHHPRVNPPRALDLGLVTHLGGCPRRTSLPVTVGPNVYTGQQEGT
jgi:hypothetical protein